MHRIRRTPLIVTSQFIAVLVLLALPLAISPAFADGELPADPTPSTELLPPEPNQGAEAALEEPIADDAETGESNIEVDPPLVDEEPAPNPYDAEITPESVIEEAEAPIVGSAADPYFTFGGIIYRFSSGATYCIDNHPLDPNCTDGLANPIQSAINDLSSRGTPDDGAMYVEDGTYVENAVIDGTAWTVTPSSLTVQSLNGSSSTTIQGSLAVQNMLDFTLQGFTVTGGVTADGNTGTLSLSDIIASTTAGTGISIINHNGDVVLDAVQANSNAGTGASIDNSTGSGNVTITDSQFNDNNTTPAGGQQGGLELTSNGTVSLDNVEASGNLDGDGASITADTITVADSVFNQNTSPATGYGNGLAAQSTGGPITVKHVTASSNEESGALLWYPASAADPTNLITVEHSRFKSNGEFGVWAQPESGTVIFTCVGASGNALGGSMVPVGETVVRNACPDKEDDKTESKHKYVGVLLSTEVPKVVNATNGVLVTFPPIQIIDPAELAIGKVWPLKKHELPAAIAEEDAFMAGVEVQMLNAEFIEDLEDGLLKIEFFIPGYLVDRQFSVLWWDLVAEEWVVIPHEFVPHLRLPGGKITIQWPQTGTFILVLHPIPAP